MRPHLAILAITLLIAPALVSARAQDASDDLTVHGTINIALGNKNGMIVLTDSMLTDGGGHQLTVPGQKLFKLDDRTVCSIAGFVSATAPISDLNASTSAIVHEYIRQSAHQSPLSILDRLRTLASLFNFRLSAIANVRDATGRATPIDTYTFELIVAGYDVDDKPKIGRITLRIKNDNGSLISNLADGEIVNVEEKLVWRLNGMPAVAASILQHPDTGPKEEVFEQYARALRGNGGASLTIEQLVELAKRLASYTSKAYPEVGGPNQIAMLQAAHTVRIDQQVFPDPPKPLINFSLIVHSTFSGNALGMAPGVHGVFVRCTWYGVRRELDGNFFIGNEFTDSVLTYGGGTVNLGDTNRVINSVLLVGPLVRSDDKTVERLSRAFPWARIMRDFSGGRP